MTVGEVLKMAAADACIHAWDIARGTGGEETLDPELVQESLGSIRHGRVYGGKAPSEVWPAMFGPPVGGLPEGNPQGQLLGLVGRDPRLLLARRSQSPRDRRSRQAPASHAGRHPSSVMGWPGGRGVVPSEEIAADGGPVRTR